VTCRDAYEEIAAASAILAEMEERGVSVEGVRSTVSHSLEAVALVLGADCKEGVLEALARAPRRFWGEVLRLLEINRTASAGEAGLDEAREALEIAVALFNYFSEVTERPRP